MCACVQYNVGLLFQIIMPEEVVFLSICCHVHVHVYDLHVLVSIVICANSLSLMRGSYM